MSESTPQKPDATPAKKLPAQPATQPAAKPRNVVAPPQPVIARSQPVRPLQATPVTTTATPKVKTFVKLAEESAAANSSPSLPPIDLDAINIQWPGQILPQRRLRLPGPLKNWITDPDRRIWLGYTAAAVFHAMLFAGLAITMRSHANGNVPAAINASTVVDRTTYLTPIARDAELATHSLPATKPGPNSLAGSKAAAQTATGLAVVVRPAVGPPAPPTNRTPPIAPQNSPPDPPTSSQPPVHEAPSNKRSPPLNAREASPAVPPPAGQGEFVLTPQDRMKLEKGVEWMNDRFRRRTPGGRIEGTHYYGGTNISEEAVEHGIGWILAHQRSDGSWSFDHTCDNCNHYCMNPGTETSSTAATGLALLPLLAAGYTHQTGLHQEAVAKALKYLCDRGFHISYGLDLRDGSMYGQALATIALCEAYGMTGDPELHDPAQAAIDYVGFCQDIKSGGWRYNPNETGDTTVTSWMLMALKSGQMAHLNVRSTCMPLAEKFLDSVQSAQGAKYGYLDRQPKPGTTAAALLCRMYLGWSHDRPALVQGVKELKKGGPSRDNLYFDYYATQVMFQFNGEEWPAWNKTMRDHLIATQDHAGHQNGSWYFESPQSAAGGRLYNTSLAVMILEVYYRQMPLYTEEAVKGK